MADTKARLFYLEDEETIREVLTAYLEMAAYQVTSARTGDEALEILAQNDFDLAILDIMVPGPSGLEVLDFLHRRWPKTATIVLTALEDEKTELEAFNHAADDFVSKPVSPILLLKRIAAILRRTRVRAGDESSYPQAASGHAEEPALEKERLGSGLHLHAESYTAYHNGEVLALTLSEFMLLKALSENQHRVLTREQLIEALYDGDYYGSDRVIDSHIKNLRKKLPQSYVKTVIGVGYQFDEKV